MSNNTPNTPHDEESDAAKRAQSGERTPEGLLARWGRFDELLNEIRPGDADAGKLLRQLTQAKQREARGPMSSVDTEISKIRRHQIGLGLLDDARESLGGYHNEDRLSEMSDYRSLSAAYEQAGRWPEALQALKDAKACIPTEPGVGDWERGLLGTEQADFDNMHAVFDRDIAALEARMPKQD